MTTLEQIEADIKLAEQFDYDDPEVVEMIERGHGPEDIYSLSGELLSLSCGRCGNAWPCPPVRVSRQRSKERRDATMGSGSPKSVREILSEGVLTRDDRQVLGLDA